MIKTRLIPILLLVFSITLVAQRTKLKPGRNIYSPQQDIDLGREAAKDAEKQLELINSPNANAYIDALGKQLAAKAPNENKFPFYFKIINDRSINAFALPGGPVYVHRGAIEAADNEAQLAGVMGHEIGHVILRHGTNQATKASLGQGALGIIGAVLGNGAGGQIAAIGGGFLANSVLLKYSRDAESEADLIGTQILYDLGYEPKAMAEFFEKLAKDHKGTKTEQFFSNHPIPENRVAHVNEEIRRLGAVRPNPRVDSPDFQEVKQIMLALPEPAKKSPASTPSSGNKRAPAAPSTHTVELSVAGIRLRHPDNWKSSVQGNHADIAPADGVINGNLAYGALVDVFQTQARDLDQATTQLLNELKRGNPSMQIPRSRSQRRIDGRNGLLTEVLNDSPAGGQEIDYVVTVQRSTNDILYFVMVAPFKDVGQYKNAFNAILDSVRLR
jgi:Zn-dependent protease with chaperone function